MPRVLIDTNILVSGLFFRGNERELLKHILFGHIKGSIPEDVVEECTRIIIDKFQETQELHKGIELFSAILSKCEIVSREKYRKKIDTAQTIIAHKKDAPVLACAMEISPDYLVSGDTDFHKVQAKVKVKIVRTKQLLQMIEEPRG